MNPLPPEISKMVEDCHMSLITADHVEVSERLTKLAILITSHYEKKLEGVEGLVKGFLDHKEEGRREFSLDEQRAYNRAVFDISKAIAAFDAALAGDGEKV